MKTHVYILVGKTGGTEMRKLLNSTQLAELLNIKISTVYAWVHYKKIPYVKLGGKLAFIEDQIIDFVSSKTFQPNI